LDATILQTCLKARGYPCGAIDGVAGVKTWGATLNWLALKDLGARGQGLALGLVPTLKAAEINTPLRVAHFLAQAGHETEGFAFLTEIGGPAYCAKYDGRADLGNVRPGDGYRYRGRGIFQITGRANYARYGKLVGADLEASPELAADPTIAVMTAGAYWDGHNLNELADANDTIGITKRINGGLNGLDNRRAYLIRLKKALGI
jgi:putative chitinase